MLKPATVSTDAVLSWLEESGVPSSDIENYGDWIHFYVSVAQANSMMSTTFHIYHNSIDNHKRLELFTTLSLQM
jgi:tripeptidyl-peptidase I